MMALEKGHLDVLYSAIQKALRKNLPLILEDAIQYLEEHDWQVKERKNRSKKPPPPLSSTEGSIKMNTPKILMESGDLTCISKTLKKITGGSPPMSIPKAIKLDFKAIRSARQVNNNRTVYQSIQNNDKKEDFGKNINKRELSRTLEDLDMSFEDFWEKCREDEHFCKLSARCLSKRASRQGSKDETKQLRICNLTTMQCNAV